MFIEITISGKVDGDGPDDPSSCTYTLRCHLADPIFPILLENQSGEGMTISEQNLFDVLHKLFQLEF